MRVVQASSSRRPAVNIHLGSVLLEIGEVARVINILKPAIALDASCLGLRRHVAKNVKIADVGGAKIPEHGIPVVLGMHARIVAAMKCCGVVLLRPMVGQRLAGNLPASNAAAISECGQHERVHAGAFLEDVENFFHAFIGERYSSNLNPDELLFGLAVGHSSRTTLERLVEKFRRRGFRGKGKSKPGRRGLQEMPAGNPPPFVLFSFHYVHSAKSEI